MARWFADFPNASALPVTWLSCPKRSVEVTGRVCPGRQHVWYVTTSPWRSQAPSPTQQGAVQARCDGLRPQLQLVPFLISFVATGVVTARMQVPFQHLPGLFARHQPHAPLVLLVLQADQLVEAAEPACASHWLLRQCPKRTTALRPLASLKQALQLVEHCRAGGRAFSCRA